MIYYQTACDGESQTSNMGLIDIVLPLVPIRVRRGIYRVRERT